MCEIDPLASAVLSKRFGNVAKCSDVAELNSLPKSIDLLTAGFPCQDISLAGTRAGLAGSRSGLISEVFRIIATSKPEFLLLENVQNLLRLGRGATMREILAELDRLKYRWAYRVVDSRGFGLPQRRKRVIILASRGDLSPAPILFARHVDAETDDTVGLLEQGHSYGFYWTEGRRGVGWTQDAVPPIKGGSGLGIPSPPAIFDVATMTATTPTIGDAERLQGFECDWTNIFLNDAPIKLGARWKMVGNAVSVPVAKWLGEELAQPASELDETRVSDLIEKRAWPNAAFGDAKKRYAFKVSTHVETPTHQPIGEFLGLERNSLSKKALTGYVKRAREGSKRFPPEFIDALQRQAELS